LGLGLAACQKGLKVRFTTAAALVHEMIEAADDRRLQRLQKLLVRQDLLIIDEPGFVPLSKTGAELLFEAISQRYERGSIVITSNCRSMNGPKSSAPSASTAQSWIA
jgi:DNA replication protein DnaC